MQHYWSLKKYKIEQCQKSNWNLLNLIFRDVLQQRCLWNLSIYLPCINKSTLNFVCVCNVWLAFRQKRSRRGISYCITIRLMQSALADYPMAASHLISRANKGSRTHYILLAYLIKLQPNIICTHDIIKMFHFQVDVKYLCRRSHDLSKISLPF